MLNRVSIQYSIDLDDLPEEVNRIYNKAKGTLNDIELPELGGEKLLTSETLKDIDTMRKKLTCLDHILSDVASIVGSYVDYEVSQINQSNQDEPNVEDAPEVPT